MNRIVTLSFAPFLVVHINPAYTRMTGLTPADILGKPFHEVIEDSSIKASTAKASSLTSLHEKVTSFLQSKGHTDANNNKFCVNVSVVGPEPADNHVDNHKNITHYMISLNEHEEEPKEQEPEAVSTATIAVGATINNPLVIPPLPILETNAALMPTMRLHCGVMG